MEREKPCSAGLSPRLKGILRREIEKAEELVGVDAGAEEGFPVSNRQARRIKTEMSKINPDQSAN